MHLTIKTNIIGVVLALFVLIQGCDKTWDEHYNTLDVTTQKEKVISELEKIPEISEFTAAVKQNDTLVDLLTQNRLYTILAPVNEAFEQIDASIVNNETLFSRLILHHFIDGKYKYKDFATANIRTFTNKKINITQVDGNVLFDSTATIIDRDYLSQNGIIQVIDKPILPLNNMYEYFIYNKYSDLFYQAIEGYTIKDFNQAASIPVDKNAEGHIIYDSVFTTTNPFLSWVEPEVAAPFYGTSLYQYIDITDETEDFTFIFPEEYETSLTNVKNSTWLNSPISESDWAGPILAWQKGQGGLRIMWGNYVENTVDQIISDIARFHRPFDEEWAVDTVDVLIYFADLLENNFVETKTLSNGQIHLVKGFEYDPSWLIKEQGGVGFVRQEKDRDDIEEEYREALTMAMTLSENVDSVYEELNNIKIEFNNDSTVDYTTKYGESVSIDFKGDFFPVDYKLMIRCKNTLSGTFKVESNGQDLGEFDFSAATSGDNDVIFDELGTVEFTKAQSSTDVKFTFVNSHPGEDTYKQLLWIREIKLVPVLN